MNYDTILPGRIRARFEHKRSRNPFKWIAISLIAVGLLCVGIWQFNQYQDSCRREEFITWVAKYRPSWNSAIIKAQWDKIKYAHEHVEIAE